MYLKTNTNQKHTDKGTERKRIGKKRVKKQLTKGKYGDKISLLSRPAEAERREHEGNAKRA